MAENGRHGEEVTRRDCYKILRSEGFGCLKSLSYGLILYDFVQGPDVVGLTDPDKWRVTEGEEALEKFHE